MNEMVNVVTISRQTMLIILPSKLLGNPGNPAEQIAALKIPGQPDRAAAFVREK